jgi:uncharacterized membrane protein YkoI
MLRPWASPRRVLGLALAVSVGTGIGLGAPSLWSASRADIPQVARYQVAGTTATTASTATAPAKAPTSSPLTLEEAKAVAAKVAPGRVVEWDQDNEPTGLRFDVELLHDDGSTTEVEVDTVTGQVTSIDHDNDRD